MSAITLSIRYDFTTKPRTDAITDIDAGEDAGNS